MFIRLLAALLISLTLTQCTQPNDDLPQDGRPNIIVIYTDDQGYADLGIQGQVSDVRTPNIDTLALSGVRMTDGYVTAPQCVPSRAGLISGQYQQRFGLFENETGPMPLSITTVPELMQRAGYVTGMVGKWHLEPNRNQEGWLEENLPSYSESDDEDLVIPTSLRTDYRPGNRGFSEYFSGTRNRYRANFDLNGNSLYGSNGRIVRNRDFRIDVQSQAALSFLERNEDQPFFLYLSYFGPHVPLEAPTKYLKRFPGEMPERRRTALAMISAIDDGVGQIVQMLEEKGLREKTLIFFVSDNGAPLKIAMDDLPLTITRGTWDGSLNTPWIGEKKLLTEGGIRVPFLASWPGVLPAGKTYSKPVITLDIGATAVALSGLEHDTVLDGRDIIPELKGDAPRQSSRPLFWKFQDQLAVREGRYKYLRLLDDGTEYLFDLESDEHEAVDLSGQSSNTTRRLRQLGDSWARELDIDLSNQVDDTEEDRFFDHYLPSSE